jgi:hypothetical protein
VAVPKPLPPPTVSSAAVYPGDHPRRWTANPSGIHPVVSRSRPPRSAAETGAESGKLCPLPGCARIIPNTERSLTRPSPILLTRPEDRQNRNNPGPFSRRRAAPFCASTSCVYSQALLFDRASTRCSNHCRVRANRSPRATSPTEPNIAPGTIELPRLLDWESYQCCSTPGPGGSRAGERPGSKLRGFFAGWCKSQRREKDRWIENSIDELRPLKTNCALC